MPSNKVGPSSTAARTLFGYTPERSDDSYAESDGTDPNDIAALKLAEFRTTSIGRWSLDGLSVQVEAH